MVCGGSGRCPGRAQVEPAGRRRRPGRHPPSTGLLSSYPTPLPHSCRSLLRHAWLLGAAEGPQLSLNAMLSAALLGRAPLQQLGRPAATQERARRRKSRLQVAAVATGENLREPGRAARLSAPAAPQSDHDSNPTPRAGPRPGKQQQQPAPPRQPPPAPPAAEAPQLPSVIIPRSIQEVGYHILGFSDNLSEVGRCCWLPACQRACAASRRPRPRTCRPACYIPLPLPVCMTAAGPPWLP